MRITSAHLVRRLLSNVLIKSKDLFATDSLFSPAKATAAATHSDILTEINATAVTKVDEQANDFFSADAPNQGLVPTLPPNPLQKLGTIESTGSKE